MLLTVPLEMKTVYVLSELSFVRRAFSRIRDMVVPGYFVFEGRSVNTPEPEGPTSRENRSW